MKYLKCLKTFVVAVILIIYLSVLHYFHHDSLEKRFSQLKHSLLYENSVKSTKAVLLVSQCRSGSSILGELFNQRVNVSYFYEPLYPFRKKDCFQTPVSLKESSVAALKSMIKCDFTKLSQLYEEAYQFTKQPDNERFVMFFVFLIFKISVIF